MRANLNFLFAILVVIGIVWLALLTRGCGGPAVPAYFDRSLTLEAGIARSAASGKPVLVLVSEDSSDACRALKRGALRSSGVAAWIKEHTVPVYIDLTRASGRDAESQAVRDRLRAAELPSIVVLERGMYAAHIHGNVRARELLAWLGRVKEDLDKERAGRE